MTDYDLHGGASGLTLAQDLPRIFGHRVPCIILTGDITTATLKVIAGSACHHVTKPVKPQVLLDLVSGLMLAARSEAAARTVAPSGADRTTVHVVDDDPMICEAMRRLFEAEGWGVATYASAEDFLAAPRPGGSACLLLDNVLPGMSGLELVAKLRSKHSLLPAVMLTGHGDATVAVAALKAGASDLIEKPASAADLLASVRRALAAAKDSQAQAEARKAAREKFSSLTPRERDVLFEVLDGAPNKIIAADLGINQRTVENHRAAVMRKTGAGSLPALIRLALAADVKRD